MVRIRNILHKMNIPGSPGIYKMIDKNNNILYIGKAKNLKNRLNSYASSSQNLKNIVMLNLVEKIEFVQTKTEIHALLLEATYIRDIKPKYNIILKDDKSFSYLYFSSDEFPSISIKRKILNKNNEKEIFFGPFYSKISAKKMLEIIKNAFKIRDCSNIFFKNRNTPCMEYHINKCSAPCVNKISYKDYQKDIINAKKFLQGENKHNLIKEYKKKMLKSSEEENYILAKSYQEKIKFLTEISINASSKYSNFDLITFIKKDDKIILCYVIYRSSILVDKIFNIINNDKNYEHNVAENVENFYKKNKTPNTIFLSKSMTKITFQQN